MKKTKYTYREIHRQPSSWMKALEYLDNLKGEKREFVKKFKDRIWVFTGCGTSYYLAQTASHLFESITGISCKAYPASEIILYPQVVFNNSSKHLFVPISRSGASTEVILANQKANNILQIPSLAVSCDPQSILVKESLSHLTFPFEKEESVIMTGSFTTMLLGLIHLAICYRDELQIADKLFQLSNDSKKIFTDYERFIKEIVTDNILSEFVFLGQGPFYGIANEAALKMQEMSISFSHSYHSLEYRHGPKSTATSETLFTVLLSESGVVYETHLLKDLQAFGAKILLLCNENTYNDLGVADFIIKVPSGFGDILNPLLYILPLQLLGYYNALSKNLNPDHPRNLTAVVEFEI
jgi:glucosamine--fructose-6-phosphate aminotransferase (isomerizing)